MKHFPLRHFFAKTAGKNPAHGLSLSLGLSLILITLSACSPKSASIYSRRDLAQPPAPQLDNFKPAGDVQMQDLLIQTRKNTPVEFDAKLTLDNGRPHNLAADANKGTSARWANGRLEVLDPVKMHMRYTPDADYSGEDTGEIYLSQGQGTVALAIVRVQVESPVQTLQPALAVRGSGCIMCHASVASNVITDFGYGDDVFLGGPEVGPMDHTSIYAEENTNPNWRLVKQLGPKVIVPQASTTSLTKVAAPTLAAFLRNTLAKAPAVAVRGTDVTEVKSMYIGAPTAERILLAAKMTSGPQQIKYIPDSGQPGDLPPLIHQTANGKDYYTNDSTKPFICSGDLVVDDVVYLNNLVLQTQTSCRIYVTKSVFESGEIIYRGGNTARQNLQIVSARSISFGLGRNDCGAKIGDTTDTFKNSFSLRLKEDDRRRFFFTRAEIGHPVQENLDRIYSEADQIGVDTMVDAACAGGKARAVGFQHLILNAPIVFSRYQGDFKGSIIAELALMSLDKFIFQFDPIFSTESVLPLLSPTDYLTVQ